MRGVWGARVRFSMGVVFTLCFVTNTSRTDLLSVTPQSICLLIKGFSRVERCIVCCPFPVGLGFGRVERYSSWPNHFPHNSPALLPFIFMLFNAHMQLVFCTVIYNCVIFWAMFAAIDHPFKTVSFIFYNPTISCNAPRISLFRITLCALCILYIKHTDFDLNQPKMSTNQLIITNEPISWRPISTNQPTDGRKSKHERIASLLSDVRESETFSTRPRLSSRPHTLNAMTEPEVTVVTVMCRKE